VRYSLTEHEKVTLLSLPLGDRVLCISATPKADMNMIRERVMKVLKENKGSRNSKPATGKTNKHMKN
jgi:hypothetical protein